TYFEGPEGFLLTKAEKKAWKEVASDEEAEAFIALFWAKRDPDLSTPVNEFRFDFGQKVEAADKMYSFESTRGALSDRALVLYLLGQPWRRDNRPPGAFANEILTPGTSTMDSSRMVPTSSLYQNQGSTEIWEYKAEELPIGVGQYFLHAVFLETEVDDNDYVLDRTNAQLMRLLGIMPEALIVHPELTEAPRSGLVAGSRPLSDDERRWLDADERQWPDSMAACATAGLARGPRHFLWLHINPSVESFEDLVLMGRVRDPGSGEELGDFFMPADELPASGGGIEVAVPVDDGRWLLDFAVANDAGVLGSKTLEIETAEAEVGETAVSHFVWGVDVQQVPRSVPGDPFNIGGWRVAPLLVNSFPTASNRDLNYMACILSPELNADGDPQFTVSTSLSKDGQVVASTSPQRASLTRLADGVWMFGRALPLGRFSQPGSYKLIVELEQTTDGTKGVAEIPFEMVEGGAGG
ncbi:MAG: GWxTD domain-containing protein, partial [Acidobacteria bacterium]|nr:GWxTD domain-containing protein [Acidobacteriota bacterium]